jgi:hypothetical protein
MIAAEEVSCGRGRFEVARDAEPARRFAADCHPVRVAAETGDVLAHPLHGKLLVHEAVIAGVADILEEARHVGRERRLDQPAEGAQAVIDRDHDDVVLGDHARGVVDGAGAGDERTAMDPEEDR